MVPLPLWRLTSGRVLTMDWVEGTKLSQGEALRDQGLNVITLVGFLPSSSTHFHPHFPTSFPLFSLNFPSSASPCQVLFVFSFVLCLFFLFFPSLFPFFHLSYFSVFVLCLSVFTLSFFPHFPCFLYFSLVHSLAILFLFSFLGRIQEGNKGL